VLLKIPPAHEPITVPPTRTCCPQRRFVWLIFPGSPAVKIKKSGQVDVCISHQATGRGGGLCSPRYRRSPVSATSSSPLLSPRLVAAARQYGVSIFTLIQSVQLPPPPPLAQEDAHVKLISPNACHFVLLLSFPNCPLNDLICTRVRNTTGEVEPPPACAAERPSTALL